MIRAVFFDLDDTLVDAMDCHRQANVESFAKFGLDYDEAKRKSKEFIPLGRKVVDVIKVRKDALNVSEEKLPLKKLVRVREEIFLKLLESKVRLLPGAVHALEQARKNVRIVAIVSSGIREYINRVLNQFNLAKYVDFIIGAEDAVKGKPNPECYEKAYELIPKELKIKKYECLVVEDSVNGVKAGKAAGMKVIFVPSKYTKGKIKADITLGNLNRFDMRLFNNL